MSAPHTIPPERRETIDNEKLPGIMGQRQEWAITHFLFRCHYSITLASTTVLRNYFLSPLAGRENLEISAELSFSIYLTVT